MLQPIARRRALISPSVLGSIELVLVEEFYGKQRAKRSQVPLISRIYEGVNIMARAGAGELAQRAFCLHPLLQTDVDLKNNFSKVVNRLLDVPSGSITVALAMEHRNVANGYPAHCRMPVSGIRLSPLAEVNQMLMGDKVQNQRDYLAYHAETYPDRIRLTEYFEQWISALFPACEGSGMVDYLTAELPPPERYWASPLPHTLVATSNSESYAQMPATVTGIPMGSHPGAFAVPRKNHVHEGVDLYCPEGTPVFAVEAGVVVAVTPFTGTKAGMPWWEDTEVVLVQGLTGVVAYGEVTPEVLEGDRVRTGDRLGTVKRVLKVDKGRPMSMLHLELHEGTARACPEWTVEKGRPLTLRDPTPYLLQLLE